MQTSHRVWLAVNGPGPWPCHRCGQPVGQLATANSGDEMRGIVHHDDRNRGNNTIGNLWIMHHACHMEEHQSLTHRELAAMIRERVRNGEMPRRFPPLLQLQTEFGVASMTVRAALKLLADEGLVRTNPGRGTFVL